MELEEGGLVAGTEKQLRVPPLTGPGREEWVPGPVLGPGQAPSSPGRC